jgi:putative restriction endonuclease
MNQYTDKLARLSTDKSSARWPEFTRHRAPHKPLLLLAVMDLIAQGSLAHNLIELNAELGELFTLYWSTIFPPDTGKRGNIAMPFWHLQSDGFWQLQPRPGQETILAGSSKIHSIGRLQDLSLGAKLDDELYEWLCTEDGRSQARAVLLATYFTAPVREVLVAQTAVNVAAFHYSEELLAAAHQTHLIKEREVETAVRDQGFRRAIVKAYEHRCAVCGLKILTADGHTAVAAAHIIPWRVSHNDDPRNGLALCHLCHWTFDKGLVTFSNQYQVKTSPQLMADANLPGHLLTFAGRKLLGPGDDALWPFTDSLRWHRREVFRTR